MLPSVTVLRTPRLELRPLTAGDAVQWHAVVWGDAEVARWLATRGAIPIERLEQFMADRGLLQWQEHGFGVWLVFDRDSGALGGHCGLIINEPGRVDLVYALGRAWWGQGLATEAARAVVDHAFGALGIDHLVATVFPGHDTSVRVLDKLGFEPAGTDSMGDAELMRFELHRDWPA